MIFLDKRVNLLGVSESSALASLLVLNWTHTGPQEFRPLGTGRSGRTSRARLSGPCHRPGQDSICPYRAGRGSRGQNEPQDCRAVRAPLGKKRRKSSVIHASLKWLLLKHLAGAHGLTRW